MLTYGTPTYLTQIRAPRGAASLSRAKRAIAASKHAKGWVRQAYLQSAVEHLADLDRAVVEDGQLAGQLVEATVEFVEEATHEEHLAAIAQVVRGSSSTPFVLALC